MVMVKLIDDDCAVLRKFKRDAKLSTYLNVVVQRAFADFRIQKWGKWRMSASARQLGRVAQWLELFLYRDGRSFDEAVETLRAHHEVELSVVELSELDLEAQLTSADGTTTCKVGAELKRFMALAGNR